MVGDIKQLRIFGTTNMVGNELSSKDFYATDWMKNDMLTNTMTYLFGDQWSNEFLLHTLTVGNALYKGGAKENGMPVTTEEYDYPVMGLFNKIDMIAENPYAITARLGEGGELFDLYFQTAFHKIGYTIESPNEYKCRIVAVEFVGTSYKYTVQLERREVFEFLPLTEVQPGVAWSELYSANSLEESGTPGEGNRVLPGKSTNQINVLRATKTVKGNTGNMKLQIKVPIGDGQVSEYLLKQDDFMFEYRWMRSKETIGWYGTYNKDRNGKVLLDEYTESGITSDVIRTGAGILQQISNTVNYGKLSFNFLKSSIFDVFFSNPETMGKKVVLITGQGGMEEFDEAMKDYINSTYAGGIYRSNDKLVQGNGEGMEVNGYFKKVYFIGGYSIEVVHNKSFDVGLRAVKSPKHPKTGFPLESYRMIFLDTDNSDSGTNLVYTYLKGYEMFDKYEPGMIGNLDAFPDLFKNLTTTEKSRTRQMRLGTCGWALLKPNTSLHFKCNIS